PRSAFRRRPAHPRGPRRSAFRSLLHSAYRHSRFPASRHSALPAFRHSLLPFPPFPRRACPPGLTAKKPHRRRRPRCPKRVPPPQPSSFPRTVAVPTERKQVANPVPQSMRPKSASASSSVSACLSWFSPFSSPVPMPTSIPIGGIFRHGASQSPARRLPVTASRFIGSSIAVLPLIAPQTAAPPLAVPSVAAPPVAAPRVAAPPVAVPQIAMPKIAVPPDQVRIAAGHELHNPRGIPVGTIQRDRDAQRFAGPSRPAPQPADDIFRLQRVTAQGHHDAPDRFAFPAPRRPLDEQRRGHVTSDDHQQLRHGLPPPACGYATIYACAEGGVHAHAAGGNSCPV